MITKLGIQNFKSIKDLNLNCKRINIFIGEPNTGKSNILEAIGMLSHVYHGELKDFVRFENMINLFYDHILEDAIRIYFDEQGLEVHFKDGRFTGFHFAKNPDGSETRSHAFGYGYQGSGSRSSQKIFSKFKFYRFKKQEDFPNQKSEFLQPPRGDNLLSVIMTRRELRRVLKEIYGKFDYKIVFKPQAGRIEIQKEIEDIIFAFPYSLTSETLQRLVFYLAAIHSSKESILTFEEPEAHAFPYYTKYLAEIVATDINENQFFIATHNPYLLVSILEKTPKDEVNIFLVHLENYQTKVKTLTQRAKQGILRMGTDVFLNIEKFLAKRK